MWQQKEQRDAIAWGQIVAGSVMLLFVVLIVFVWLSNHIGIGKALAVFVLTAIIFAWIIIGAILLARGISRW